MGKTRKSKTRRRASWRRMQPRGRQRTTMYKKCGRKCFLGPPKRPHPSFPICTKGTCRINRKGVHAAYARARQWGKKQSLYKGKSRPSMKRRVYTRVSRRAESILKRRRTKSRRRR
jgi:hypothetical protein